MFDKFLPFIFHSAALMWAFVSGLAAQESPEHAKSFFVMAIIFTLSGWISIAVDLKHRKEGGPRK